MNHGVKILLCCIALAAVVGASILLWEKNGKPNTFPREAGERLSVAATVYPLAEFARAVGGDAVMVTGIVPAGVEPHEYEPTPRDILTAYRADIFLSNGAGIDAWAEKISQELENRGIAAVTMAAVIGVSPRTTDGGTIADPHFWLDPVWAQQEIVAIRDALIARDPTHADLYARNADQYVTELAALDTAYRTGLRRCQLHTIATSHDAFAYLAKRYGFEVISVSGMSPEAEPSPRTLAGITRTVRTLGLRHIFFETLSSPRVAQTLAEEVGAQTLVFNPLEGLTDEERQAGKNYMSIMYDNLDNLRTALRCQVGQL
ncbi:MAG: zinc ABC transporter substrate-binding protein [Candidatus Moraniibacteriota bacterium]